LITGDKKDTAISVGILSGMFMEGSTFIELNKYNAKLLYDFESKDNELAISSEFLRFLQRQERDIRIGYVKEICKKRSVVFCRVSPKEK
jgi:magnesium-transporting ATPase (P-type)